MTTVAIINRTTVDPDHLSTGAPAIPVTGDKENKTTVVQETIRSIKIYRQESFRQNIVSVKSQHQFRNNANSIADLLEVSCQFAAYSTYVYVLHSASGMERLASKGKF
jgi:hypothetical protein